MIPYEYFRKQWVAVRTDDPLKMLQPIHLSDFSTVDWEVGMKAVFQQEEKLFISPVMNGWVLFFGDIDAVLERYAKQQPKEHDPALKEGGWHAALAQMSTLFPEVQLFEAYDDHWQYARAVNGKIQRALSIGDGFYEIGMPSPEEIRLGGTAIPEFRDQCVEFLSSELPYVMAGTWSVNPLEWDEPQWDWLRNSRGLLYNGISDTQRETLEWLENWNRRLKLAIIEDKYGVEINRPN